VQESIAAADGFAKPLDDIPAGGDPELSWITLLATR